MITIKEKADELVEQYLNSFKPYKSGVIIVTSIEHAIISTKNTIEVLERIKRTDKEAGRLLHFTSQIELDEQTEILKELESRL